MPYTDRSQKRKFQREWCARRRAEYIAARGPCCRCGSWDQLEFDHIDRTQKINHRIWGWSKPRLEAELSKCQVLCRPCHILKGVEDGTVKQINQHGTNALYKKGCRCPLCVEQKAADDRRYREKKRQAAVCG